MGVNRLKAYPEALKSALSKLTRRPSSGDAPQARSGMRLWPSLSEAAIVRLARHILNSNRHLRRFEVELGDEMTCEAVSRELEESGCGVRRIPFKWMLEVTCPEEPIAKRAA